MAPSSLSFIFCLHGVKVVFPDKTILVDLVTSRIPQKVTDHVRIIEVRGVDEILIPLWDKDILVCRHLWAEFVDGDTAVVVDLNRKHQLWAVM